MKPLATGLDWTGQTTGLDYTQLDWMGLNWTGLDWTKLNWTTLKLSELICNTQILMNIQKCTSSQLHFTTPLILIS